MILTILTVVSIASLVWLIVGFFYYMDLSSKKEPKEIYFWLLIKIPTMLIFLVILIWAVEKIC